MHATLLNSKVSKNIRNQGETLFCWAFAISTMLRQSLNLFISKLNAKLLSKTDVLKKLNSIDFHRQLRNELIMIPIPKYLSNEFNQDSALNQGHYLNLAFERVNNVNGVPHKNVPFSYWLTEISCILCNEILAAIGF